MIRVFSVHNKLTRSIASHAGKTVRNFARNRMPLTPGDGSRGRPSALDMISHLDAANDDNKTMKNLSAKLQKGLEKENKAVLDNVSQGTTDTTAEEIREIINEFLESSKFRNVFKGFKDSSQLVEIVEVSCNRDFSNTTAYWQSLPMEVFIHAVKKKLGLQAATKFSKKIGDTIDTKLRVREGLVRSYLLKKMDFKRVPRVMFRPYDPSFGLNTENNNHHNHNRKTIYSDDLIDEEDDRLDTELGLFEENEEEFEHESEFSQK